MRQLEIDLEDQLDPLGGLQQVAIAIGRDKIVCDSYYDPGGVCRLRLAAFPECRGAEDDVGRFLLDFNEFSTSTTQPPPPGWPTFTPGPLTRLLKDVGSLRELFNVAKE